MSKWQVASGAVVCSPLIECAVLLGHLMMMMSTEQDTYDSIITLSKTQD